LSYNKTMSANDPRDDAADAAAGDAAFSPEPGLTVLLRVAAAFLTRLPVPPGPAGETLPDDILARAMPLFPLIGAGIGLLGGMVLLIAGWLGLPALVAAIAALGTLIWLTGALHEDGLADLADGFGGGDRNARLAIMRDSRIGSYGVLALLVAFALKAAALAAIFAAGPWLAVAALIAAAAWSRALFAPLMCWLPAARTDGVAAGAGQPGVPAAWRALILGAALALLATIGGTGGGAILALAAGGFAAFIIGWLALDHVGGYTGDVLGAAQQAAETTTLVAFSALVTGGLV
jgi:adenosylcobinamide-GDP ribazoletransferase